MSATARINADSVSISQKIDFFKKTENAPIYRGIFLLAGILLELGSSNV